MFYLFDVFLFVFLQAFVASNPRIVWCPYPGCGQAIQNPERNRSASVTSRTSQHSSSQQYQLLAAHCNNGHNFCWQCQMEPHDPASCEDYKRWLEKIVQVFISYSYQLQQIILPAFRVIFFYKIRWK